MVWLVVLLVTGEVVESVAPVTLTECRRVQAAVADGKRVMAAVEGDDGEHRVVQAACREVGADDVPSS